MSETTREYIKMWACVAVATISLEVFIVLMFMDEPPTAYLIPLALPAIILVGTLPLYLITRSAEKIARGKWRP